MLQNEYCLNVIQDNNCSITIAMLEKAITRLQDNKSPGNDLIVVDWYKHFKFYVNELTTLFSNTFSGNIEIPNWLTKAKTVLLPKNNDLCNPKNYRPIALQNTMLKLYTKCINYLLQRHCEKNSIITVEYAGGKKEVWGCTKQLMINKTILEEVKVNRRSLIFMWLDYQKAFDSVPHEWLIKSLELAKVPTKIINALKKVIKKWATNIHLQGNEQLTEIKLIHYLRGIFQGDSL